jgi:hypothetical protein
LTSGLIAHPWLKCQSDSIMPRRDQEQDNAPQ